MLLVSQMRRRLDRYSFNERVEIFNTIAKLHGYNIDKMMFKDNMEKQCGLLAPLQEAHAIVQMDSSVEFGMSTVQQEQETENTMYNLDQLQLEHFTHRLSRIKSEKHSELKRKFGLVDDDEPRTAEEIVARITAGKFIVLPEGANSYSGSRFARFQWRDPSLKEDRAGYEAADKDLDAAYALAKDAVFTAPADAAKVVQAFESAK